MSSNRSMPEFTFEQLEAHIDAWEKAKDAEKQWQEQRRAIEEQMTTYVLDHTDAEMHTRNQKINGRVKLTWSKTRKFNQPALTILHSKLQELVESLFVPTWKPASNADIDKYIEARAEGWEDLDAAFEDNYPARPTYSKL